MLPLCGTCQITNDSASRSWKSRPKYSPSSKEVKLIGVYIMSKMSCASVMYSVFIQFMLCLIVQEGIVTVWVCVPLI